MKMAKSNKKKVAIGRRQFWVMPLLALLIVIALAAVFLFVNNETRVSVKETVYQYSMNQRMEYAPGTVLLPGKYTIILETDGQQIDGDPTPIYSREAEALYLAQDAAWSDPTNGVQWRIPAFSRLELQKDGTILCNVGQKAILLNGGILNDCTGTWLFLDEVSLSVNGQVFELVPLSFCSVTDEQIRIYDYAEKNLHTENELRTNLSIKAERGYETDLTTGIYTNTDGSYYLMAGNTSVLHSIEER